MVEQLWLDLKVAQLTESKISEQFFDGYRLLMRDQQTSLDSSLKLLEETLELLSSMAMEIKQVSSDWRRKKGGAKSRQKWID